MTGARMAPACGVSQEDVAEVLEIRHGSDPLEVVVLRR